MLRPYAGAVILEVVTEHLNGCPLTAPRTDLRFTEANSEEEAKDKMGRESYEEAVGKDWKIVGPPRVLLRELPQDLIDKYASPAPTVPPHSDADEDRKFTNLPVPPDATTGPVTGPSDEEQRAFRPLK